MIVSTPRPLNVIGLNSGTSMDGIDAALYSIAPADPDVVSSVRPRFRVQLISSLVEEFPEAFQKRLKALVSTGQTTLADMCVLNTALGELFANAAARLVDESKSLVDRVHLIGSHGQTLWHAPKSRSFWGVTTAGTLQFGEPAIIAARTGVPVIANFRANDIAYGGEGAPLVAFADEVLFGADGIATGVLNLGGIANLTIVDKTGEAVMAFDTGPANMVIDRMCERLKDRPFDDGGELAASGSVNQELLNQLLNNPYFTRRPPKTTGREDFGVPYADRIIDENAGRLSAVDLIATATALTADSIANAYKRYAQPVCTIERLVLGGGGASNKTLVDQLNKRLSEESKIVISQHEEFGLSTKFKESLLFALLAYTSYFKIPNNVPACTGARRRVCLGQMIRPT